MLRATSLKLGVMAAIGAASLTLAGFSVPAAAAPSAAPLMTSAATTNCEGAVVQTPSAAAQGNVDDLAKALGTSASNPLVTSAVKGHKHWLTTMSCEAMPDHTRQHLPKATEKAALPSGEENPIWAGSVLETDSSVNYAEMQWTVPSLTYVPTEPFNQGEYTSIWPGIGGWNDDAHELIQAGSEQDILCASDCQANYAWWELYPDVNQQKITNLPVNTGDNMHVYVTKQSSTSAQLEICNPTTCVSFTKTAKKAIGTTAEWILERTTENGATYPLPNFGRFEVYGYYSNNKGTTESGGPGVGTPVDMYNDPDQLTSTVIPTFSDTGAPIPDEAIVTWVAPL